MGKFRARRMSPPPKPPSSAKSIEDNTVPPPQPGRQEPRNPQVSRREEETHETRSSRPDRTSSRRSKSQDHTQSARKKSHNPQLPGDNRTDHARPIQPQTHSHPGMQGVTSPPRVDNRGHTKPAFHSPQPLRHYDMRGVGQYQTPPATRRRPCTPFAPPPVPTTGNRNRNRARSASTGEPKHRRSHHSRAEKHDRPQSQPIDLDKARNERLRKRFNRNYSGNTVFLGHQGGPQHFYSGYRAPSQPYPPRNPQVRGIRGTSAPFQGGNGYHWGNYAYHDGDYEYYEGTPQPSFREFTAASQSYPSSNTVAEDGNKTV